MHKILNKIGSDTICPVTAIVRDKRILLGLRNYTPDKWKAVSVWTVPGGRCDPGETVEETLRREVEEEIGITDLSFTHYLGNHPGAKEGDVIEVFAAESTQEPQNMEPHKFTEWKWFGLEDWPENFINPQVEELFRSLLK